VLFVYNRPWHTRQTLEALTKNDLSNHSRLFIFADGPKKNTNEEDIKSIHEVRDIIKEKKWCGHVEIIERNENLGLANSVTEGINEIIGIIGRIIVLEDDLLTSPGFLRYLNAALLFYDNYVKVKCISAYSFPIKSNEKGSYFLKTGATWGWATWLDDWKIYNNNTQALLNAIPKEKQYEFNFNDSYDFLKMLNLQIDGTINSWDINWYTSIFLENGLTLYPPKTLVKNIGFDGSGRHFTKKHHGIDLNSKELWQFNDISDLKFSTNIIESIQARKALINYFKVLNGNTTLDKLKNKIKAILRF